MWVSLIVFSLVLRGKYIIKYLNIRPSVGFKNGLCLSRVLLKVNYTITSIPISFWTNFSFTHAEELSHSYTLCNWSTMYLIRWLFPWIDCCVTCVDVAKWQKQRNVLFHLCHESDWRINNSHLLRQPFHIIRHFIVTKSQFIHTLQRINLMMIIHLIIKKSLFFSQANVVRPKRKLTKVLWFEVRGSGERASGKCTERNAKKKHTGWEFREGEQKSDKQRCVG